MHYAIPVMQLMFPGLLHFRYAKLILQGYTERGKVLLLHYLVSRSVSGMNYGVGVRGDDAVFWYPDSISKSSDGVGWLARCRVAQVNIDK